MLKTFGFSLLVSSCLLLCQSGKVEAVNITILLPAAIGVYNLFFQHKEYFEADNAGTIVHFQNGTGIYNFEQINDDLKSDNPIFHGFIGTPSWIPSWVEQGLLEDLTQLMRSSATLDLTDIFPVVLEAGSQYQGKLYSVPLDGDYLLGVYPKDLFQHFNITPPKTWEKFAEISQKWNNTIWKNKTMYGNCFISKPTDQGFFSFMYAIASSYLQANGTKQGVFFNTETLQPLFQTPAWAAAAKVMKVITSTSAPEVGLQDFNFTDGQCALGFHYPGWVKPARVRMPGNLGIFQAPGTSNVALRQPAISTISTCSNQESALEKDAEPQSPLWTDTTVTCDENPQAYCPFGSMEQVDENTTSIINYSPFLASGGNVGMVRASASDEEKKAVYKFFEFCSSLDQSKVDVAGPSIFDPFRYSHILEPDIWIDNNWTLLETQALFRITQRSFVVGNAAKDISILKSEEYMKTFSLTIAKFLFGDEEWSIVSKELDQAWNKLTSIIGLAKQRKTYRLIIALIVVCAILVVGLSYLCTMKRKLKRTLELRDNTSVQTELANDLKSALKIKIFKAVAEMIFELVDIILDWVAFVAVVEGNNDLVPAYSIAATVATAASVVAQFNRAKILRKLLLQRKGVHQQVVSNLKAKAMELEDPLARLQSAVLEIRKLKTLAILCFAEDIPMLSINLFIVFRNHNAKTPLPISIQISVFITLIGFGWKLRSLITYFDLRGTRVRLSSKVLENKNGVEMVEKSSSFFEGP